MDQLYSQAINQINQVRQSLPTETKEVNEESFDSLLTDSITALDTKQAESTQALHSVIDGTADDLHTVMIETTEAQLSLEVAVQLRNRALEAYNEIKNMQF